MMRVPADPANPTFDNTFTVGFWRWLTSSKAERVEWARRCNAAAEVARQGQNRRVQDWADRKVAESKARHAQRQDER